MLTANLFAYLDTSSFTFGPEQTNKNIFHPYKRVIQTDAVLYLHLPTNSETRESLFLPFTSEPVNINENHVP